MLITNDCFSQHPAEFLSKRKWGVMHHFLADFYSAESPQKWNKLIDGFDAKSLADQLESVHAGWVIFTIGQNSGYYCSPNSVYDNAMKYNVSHCSNRDLISDLADALNAKGIPLIVYIPFGFLDSHHPKYSWYSDMIQEYSLRWGKKIKGWWFDGYYGSVEFIPEMAKAALSGNPDAILAFNPGEGIIDRTSEYENYTAGEYNDILHVNGLERFKNGAQWHCVTKNTLLWGGMPSNEEQKIPLYSDKEICNITLKITNNDCAITWNVDLDNKGNIKPGFYRLLKNINSSISFGKNCTLPSDIKDLFIRTDQNTAINQKTKVMVWAILENGEYANLTGMVKYKLSDASFGEIKNGYFSANRAGEVSISARIGNKVANVPVKIQSSKLSLLKLRTGNNSILLYDTVVIVPFGLMNDSTAANLKNAQIKYNVNKPDLAQIDEKGNLVAKKSGRVLVYAVATLNNISKQAMLPLVIANKEQVEDKDENIPPFISIASKETMVLDGKLTEKIWNTAFEYPLSYNQRTFTNYTPPDDSNIKASFMLCYKGDTVFGIIKRSDDITYTSNCLSFINDGVEIYINMDGIHKQLISNVGTPFLNGSFNNGYSKIMWNPDGTIGEFAIQIPGLDLRSQTLEFNLDVVDNDDKYKVYQLFPVNGYGKSFMGKNMAKLKFIE